MAIQHPADRGGSRRTKFDQVAEYASYLSSSSWFFVTCLLIIGVWITTYATDTDETYRHLAADVLAAVTLGMVALLKNAEMRSERAMQQKLDLIAAALLEQDQDNDREARDRLREAIGLHDQV